MFRSTLKPYHILLAIVVIGLMAFTLAFAPAAVARGFGKGGGGSFGGGGSRAPSIGRSAPSPSRSAPRSRSFSAPRSQGYSNTNPNRSFGKSTPRYSAPTRTAPNTSSRTYRSPSSGNVPTGGSSRQFGKGSSTQTNPSVRSGAGPSSGQLRAPQGNVTPRTPGEVRSGRFGSGKGSVTNPNATRPTNKGNIAPSQTPGTTSGTGNKGGRGFGKSTQTTTPTIRGGGPGGRERGTGTREHADQPGQAREQWGHDRNRHHDNWHHEGDWNHNDHWGWNDSFFSFGLFFYPGFGASFNYGYWGFNYCEDYCSYSPFYYYGLPYVYAPRVVVTEVPVYTYVPVPDYAYGNDYYLSQGSYSGLNAAMDDIRNGWINGNPEPILRHVATGTQIAVYLDNNYAYSLGGTDYRNMVNDAIGRIRTISFSIDNVEQRSDGAYIATGTHDFYDLNNNHKVINVSYTLANKGGNWVIVAVGSAEVR